MRGSAPWLNVESESKPMKIVDGIGNNIHNGSTLYWKSKDLFVKLDKVIDPEGKIPGGLLLILALPINGKGETIQIPDFIRTVDPQAEATVEALAKEEEMVHTNIRLRGGD